MSTQDLLSDALTRIRNAQLASHSFVTVHSSKLIRNSLDLLEREGYIRGYKEFEERQGVKNIKVALKYHKGSPVISKLQRVSKPGRRVYSGKNVQKTNNGLGVTAVTTSVRGVISDREAREFDLGGEVLFKVY